MEKDQFISLLAKYREGYASPEEQRLLEAWYNAFEPGPDVLALLTAEEKEKLKAQIGERIREKIREQEPVTVVHRVHFLRRFRWAAAAVLIGIAVVTGIILTKEKPIETASVYKNDVAPGKPGAKLKLSGGRVIELDNMKDGFIASEGGYQIYKQNGEIVYKGSAITSAELIYNELIADKKQMSSATLPDGTIAWVNASSSVRYPVQFTGSERTVTMTGEAIFRVKHNEKQPFKVHAGTQVFEDIGTEFNVNAYTDEPVIRTTVLEGSVKTGTMLVGAGQQAVISKNGSMQLKTMDTEQVFAWRDQQFNFSGAAIEQIMTQAARWYDVDVVYQEPRVNQQFTIGFSRDKPIVEFLQALERAGHVHFEVEGKRVTVKP